MTDQVPPVPQVPQPPQPASPQPQEAPKKKGLPVLAWIGIGCGTIILLTIIGLVALGGYAIHKVKQAGFDPGLWKKNPTAAAAKIVTTMNPDVEVVSTDNDSQTITIRNKKTGKTVTIDLQDIKDGKFRFFDEKGKESTVTLSKSGNEKESTESGTLNIKSSQGNFNISTGAGADKLPKWVPLYEGIAPERTIVMKADKGASGSYSIVVQEPVEEVADRMEKKLKNDGFTVSKNSYAMNDKKMVTISGEKGDKFSITVVITNTEEGTGMNVSFSEKFGS